MRQIAATVIFTMLFASFAAALYALDLPYAAGAISGFCAAVVLDQALAFA